MEETSPTVMGSQLQPCNPQNTNLVSHSGNSQKCVLVIDESPGVCSTLERILTAQGLSVRCAADAISGLCEVCEFSPDLVLMETFAVKLDAFQFVRLLDLKGRSKGLELIMMMDRDDIFLKAKAEAAGAGHLLRPFSEADLLKLFPVNAAKKCRAGKPAGRTNPSARPGAKDSKEAKEKAA